MKPNIIIVMTDQQRADLRKANGCTIDTMPFLDEWSKGGVDFEKGYSPNPICLAARISMFTGRYSQSHKARTNANVRDTVYSQDLLDILKAQGYKTAICGKNHTHREISDFDFYETNDHFTLSKENEITERDNEFCEFLINDAAIYANKAAPHGVEAQFPYKNVSSTLKFIDSIEKDTPFFVWLSMAEPHGPYQVPEPYFDMFPPSSLPKCTTANDAKIADKGFCYEKNREEFTKCMGNNIDDAILRCRSNYFGMLRLIDDQFKRLINNLNDRGINDNNTIIIYLSDHGDVMGEYGLIRKGDSLSNLLCNIPMIWKGCGVEKIGKQDKSFVNLVDVFPTICDIIGVENPTGVQGKSILPLLKNSSDFDNEFDVAYMESGYSGLYWTSEDTSVTSAQNKIRAGYNCLNAWTQSGQVRSLCYKNYRIQLDMMGVGYLYNLNNDWVELNNLWNNEDYKDIKLEMLERMMAVSLQNCDVFPLAGKNMPTKIHPKGYWYQDYTV